MLSNAIRTYWDRQICFATLWMCRLAQSHRFTVIPRCVYGVFQKARNPEYAVVFDAEPKAKGRGRKKGT